MVNPRRNAVNIRLAQAYLDGIYYRRCVSCPLSICLKWAHRDICLWKAIEWPIDFVQACLKSCKYQSQLVILNFPLSITAYDERTVSHTYFQVEPAYVLIKYNDISRVETQYGER